MALVTVILTTLNSERFVVRSIESCLNQTHQNLELLIVDGGSQDRTLEILGSYNDTRIRIIHQEDNTGKLPGALNLGMAHARGEFITWAQDDSWYELNAIETMLEYLNSHPDVGLVYCDYWDVDEAGNPLRYQKVHPPEDILVDDVIRQCFLFRREVYDTIGPQDTKYHPVHEVPWRIRVANAFKIQPLHVPLMYYGLHPGSLTGRIGGWQLQRMMADALLQEGHLDNAAYNLRIAQFDIDQAYDEYILQGNYRAFWRYALSGIWRNWRNLGNRGLWKLMLMSLSPVRDKYRNALFSNWLEADNIHQQNLVEQYAQESQNVQE